MAKLFAVMMMWHRLLPHMVLEKDVFHMEKSAHPAVVPTGPGVGNLEDLGQRDRAVITSYLSRWKFRQIDNPDNNKKKGLGLMGWVGNTVEETDKGTWGTEGVQVWCGRNWFHEHEAQAAR